MKVLKKSEYWNHNTAYHNWIISNVKGKNKVLDVGCGDGLLVYKLASFCKQVIGIDTHLPSIDKARKRINNFKNISIENTRFEKYKGESNSFDAIVFVASIHHMDFDLCIKKSKKLLKPNGLLLIVGLAHPYNIVDKVIELVRFIPVKIGDIIHNVKGDVGAPITDWKENMNDIRTIAKNKLPNSKIKQALYYRYLLIWKKPNDKSNIKLS